MSRYLVWLVALLFIAGAAPSALAQGDMDAPAEEEMAEEAMEEAAPEAAEEVAEEAAAAEEAPEDIPEISEGDVEEEDGGGESFETASDDFLTDTSEWLDDNAVAGVFRIRATLGAELVYDSNIFLNDEDEEGTQGVVDDFIVRLKAVLAAEVKVNNRYTKVFRRDRITLLSFDYVYNLYLDNDEVSNSNWNIGTDLFGFFSDLFSVSGGRSNKGFYYELKANYSKLTDPLDLVLKNFQVFPAQDIKDVDQLRRTEIHVDAEIGWIGNGWDIALGYRYEKFEFDEKEFEQANNTRNTVTGEFGLYITGKTRAYIRGEYAELEYPAGLLNDADIVSGVLGLEGFIISNKLRYDVNGGVMNWDSQPTGISGDDNDYDGGIGWGTIVYRPLEESALTFQLDGGRKLDWSAISNYRIDDSILFTVRDEFMPKRLAWDLSAKYSTHEQSEGPRWTRLELGAGLEYTPHGQVLVSLRYLYRTQDSDEDYEIVNGVGTPQETSTNGNFVQHLISLGLEVRF